jgi:hypothetical protein
MRTMPVLLALGCAPPPVTLSPSRGGGGPSIEILYPEPGQQVVLEPGCVLTEPLVVHVRNLDLAPPGEPVDGQGHWHGGPDLDEGYCASSVAFCEGEGDAEESFTRYDGSGRTAGPLNLYASLHANDHRPLGVEDLVEIELVAADGEACP